jgi:Tol biopolymer transport system component
MVAVAPGLGPAPHGFAAHLTSDSALDGRLRRLTEPGAGDNRATYMPDGKTLLFVSKRSGASQHWSMDSAGGHPRRVHESKANDFGRVAPNTDGTRLCFSSDRTGENAIHILDLASGQVTLVSDPTFWSFGPTWSSRDLIAFFSRKGGNVINIWTVRPDGSNARQITNQPGESRQPWWSPDGETLALAADRGSGTFGLWLLAADGSHPRQITRHGTFQQPFWSPDGSAIAVSAKIDEPRYRIYVIAADGGRPRPIPQPVGVDNVHPAWSPDGRSIAFTSEGEGGGCIQVLDLA